MSRSLTQKGTNAVPFDDIPMVDALIDDVPLVMLDAMLRQICATSDPPRFTAVQRVWLVRVCYAILRRLHTLSDTYERWSACTSAIDAAALVTLSLPGCVWSRVLDDAWVRYEAIGSRIVPAFTGEPTAHLRVRIGEALSAHPTDALALALLRQYRSHELRRIVLVDGTPSLTPALEAAALTMPLTALAGLLVYRPYGCVWARIRKGAQRQALDALEAADPRELTSCALLRTYIELTQIYPARPWGRRVLRAVARWSRHHDIHHRVPHDVHHGAQEVGQNDVQADVQPGGPMDRTPCGLRMWYAHARRASRLHADEVAEVLRLGLPLTRDLDAHPWPDLSPGVLELLGAPELPDAVAVGTARSLTAEDWRVAELGLATRAAIRADSWLRARLALSEHPDVHTLLASDEPLATLRDRLRWLLATSESHAAHAIEQREEDAVQVLHRADVLPLLRSRDSTIRLTGQRLLHRLVATPPPR